MRLVLLRHAEKAPLLTLSSPPLSAEGEKQAQKLLEFVRQGKLPPPHKICCSPKVRSRQTLQPLADEFDIENVEIAELDERRNNETYDQFRERVQKLLERAETFDKTTYLCTHLDWIEEALAIIPADSDLGSYQNWGSGQFMVFQIEHRQPWQLQEFGRIKT